MWGRRRPVWACAMWCALRVLWSLHGMRPLTSSSEMAHRECHPGTRLQIALEGQRAALVSELHDDIDDPWPARGRVWALSRIVSVETGAPVAGYAGVVTGSIRSAPEHVHVAFWICHGSHRCNLGADGSGCLLQNAGMKWSIDCSSCLPGAAASGRFCGPPSRCALRWASFASPLNLARYLWSAFARIQSEGWLAIRSSLCEVLRAKDGGPDRDRTGDLMNAIHARSQLRYWPTLEGC